MSKRGSGIGLLAIATALYAARYMAAAIFGTGLSSWSAEQFQAMLQYVGEAPLRWSVAAGGLGIVYLVWGEVEALIARRK
jgi:hypothetical protein